MRIESYLPEMARRSATGPPGAEPAPPVADVGHELMHLLGELVGCAGYSLSAWDPLSGTHRHHSLVRRGYDDAVAGHMDDGFVRDNPAFGVLHRRVPRALRWKDLLRDFAVDVAGTETGLRYLIPAGYAEGATACLRQPDGRYTGSVHISWSTPEAATDERRELIDRAVPLLATACDPLRDVWRIADHLAPGTHGVVLAASGRVTHLPNRSTGELLATDAPLLRYVQAAGPTRYRRFLWPHEGVCHRVIVVPCGGKSVVVSEARVAWPYDLTGREIQILHLLARGYSNPQIAAALVISRRTVSTHVEHVLAKVGCASRTELAARAVEEGLLLAEDPRVRSLRTPPGRPWDQSVT